MRYGRFGSLLRTERVSRGIKQAALASELKITHVYLWQLEAGQKPPLDPEKIRAAAAYLGIAPGSLLIAAAVDRGAFPGLPASASDPYRCEAAHEVTDRWSVLTVEQIARVLEVIRK